MSDKLLSSPAPSLLHSQDWLNIYADGLARTSMLPETLEQVYAYLTELAQSDRFYDIFEQSFGLDFDRNAAEKLRQLWQLQSYQELPRIEILPLALGNARGAYSQETNTIYLSDWFVLENIANRRAIAAVILEEMGHYIDAKINSVDTTGDEGEKFAALVEGRQLDPDDIKRIAYEEDIAVIQVGGRKLLVEQAGPVPEDDAPNSSSVRVNTTLRWEDENGALHSIRAARVRILTEGFRGNTIELATARTNELGQLIGTDGNLGVSIEQHRIGLDGEIYLEVEANGVNHQIVPDRLIDTNSRPFKARSESFAPDSNTERSFTVGYPSSSMSELERLLRASFSVNDAFYVAEQFYNLAIRDTIPITQDRDSMPEVIVLEPTNSLYPSRYYPINIFSGQLYINELDSYNWDVILHEYGHFIASEKQWFDLDEGRGSHSMGFSSIYRPDIRFDFQAYTKERGILIAWSEGLANYLSLAIQQVARQQGWTNRDFDLNYSSGGEKFGIESHGNGIGQARHPQGEGDELAVVRILWDLADGRGESLGYGLTDSIALGHQEIFEILDNIDRLETLEDLWEGLTSSANNWEKADIGAIFEANGVSPVPTLTTNTVYTEAPRFEWLSGNQITVVPTDEEISIGLFEANDNFFVKIYDQNFNEVLASPAITHNYWQLSSDMWSMLEDGQGYYLVVEGADTVNGVKGNNHNYEDITGYYWSGARLFSKGVSAAIGTQGLKRGVNLADSFQRALQSANAFSDLPLIGDVDANSRVISFFTDLQQGLTSQVNGLADFVLPQELTQAFIRGLVEAGIDATSDDIDVVRQDNGTTRFNFSIEGNLVDLSQPITASLNLPGLGLALNPGSNLNLGIDYKFNFFIEIDRDGNVGFGTPEGKDLELDLKATFPGTELNGKLGFLQIAVKDDATDRSSLGVGLDIDIDRASVDVSAEADLNLDIRTGFAGSETLPSLLTDFEYSWVKGNGTLTPANFKNVRLDTGSFFSGFASPILSRVQRYTQPLQPFVNFLNQEHNLGLARVNFRDIARAIRVLNNNDSVLDANGEAFLDSISGIVSLVNSIPTTTSGSNFAINLGDFNLGTADITDANLNLSGIAPSITNSPDFFTQALNAPGQQQNFFRKLGPTGTPGLSFPILSDRNQAFNLLLGKDAQLFRYDMPILAFSGGYSQYFPIFGPLGLRLGGRLGASADLGFGFDTYGLRQISQGGAGTSLFNGLYIDADSRLNFNAGLSASAELNVAVASAGAGGNVTGNLNLGITDPNRDGKVRLNELDNSPFNLSGNVTAGLHAYLRVGWRWFSYTKWFRSPQRELFRFGQTANNVVVTTETAIEIPVVDGGVSSDMNDGSPIPTPKSGAKSKLLLGTATEDSILGGEYNDLLVGGAGADSLIGGDGLDVASYFNAGAGVFIDLQTGQKTGDALGDTYKSIEQIEGSAYDDTLLGRDDADDIFDSLDGNDTLSGRGGNDVFIGSQGADRIDGGTGTDLVSYLASEESVFVNLLGGVASRGHAAGDTIIGVENVEGSDFHDHIIGDGLDNILRGGKGNDTLEGGNGFDILVGGDGNDIFMISGQGADTIEDFNVEEDRLWLSIGVTHYRQLSITQRGSDTLIGIQGNSQHMAVLSGINASSIDGSHFFNTIQPEPYKPYDVGDTTFMPLV